MPFKSKSQLRACFASKNPNWDCHEWAHKTKSIKDLPEHIKKAEVIFNSAKYPRVREEIKASRATSVVLQNPITKRLKAVERSRKASKSVEVTPKPSMEKKAGGWDMSLSRATWGNG